MKSIFVIFVFACVSCTNELSAYENIAVRVNECMATCNNTKPCNIELCYKTCEKIIDIAFMVEKPIKPKLEPTIKQAEKMPEEMQE